MSLLEKIRSWFIPEKVYENNEYDLEFSNEFWNCKPEFKKRCPLKWSDIKETDVEGIRFCRVCDRNVYECKTPEEFMKLGNEGKCVAVMSEAKHLNISVALFGEPSIKKLKKVEEDRKTAISFWKKIITAKPSFETKSIEKIKESIKMEEDPDYKERVILERREKYARE